MTNNEKLIKTLEDLQTDAAQLGHGGLAGKLEDTQKLLRTEIQVQEKPVKVITFAVIDGKICN